MVAVASGHEPVDTYGRDSLYADLGRSLYYSAVEKKKKYNDDIDGTHRHRRGCR